MDLSKFDTRKLAEEGTTIHLTVEGTLLRGGDDKPIDFVVKGTDSPVIRDYLKKSAGEQKAEGAEALAERDIEFACELCIGWSDNASLKGKAFKYSRKNAEVLFAIPAIREALILEATKRANFMQKD